MGGAVFGRQRKSNGINDALSTVGKNYNRGSKPHTLYLLSARVSYPLLPVVREKVRLGGKMIELNLAVFIVALVASALVGVFITACINTFASYRRDEKEIEEKRIQNIEKRLFLLEGEQMRRKSKDKEEK